MWESEIEFDGRTVEVDADFGDDFDGAGVARFVSDIGRFDRLARQAMRESWDEDGSYVRLYAEHHVDELGAEISADLDAFLARIHLTRVGFEPDDPERYAVFDYTIGSELTQYLLVVVFNGDGEIIDVAMES